MVETKIALRVALSELRPVKLMSPVAVNTRVPRPPWTLAPSTIAMVDPFMTTLPAWLLKSAVEARFKP